MLLFYLKTVVIWMIIIQSVVIILKGSIKEKGWLDDVKKSTCNGFVALFALSAVPIIRFLVVCMMFYMATHTKEQFKEWQEKNKTTQN